MIEIRKTETFAKWVDGLQDTRARARILVRIERLAAGNPGDVKPVGEGGKRVTTVIIFLTFVNLNRFVITFIGENTL